MRHQSIHRLSGEIKSVNGAGLKTVTEGQRIEPNSYIKNINFPISGSSGLFSRVHGDPAIRAIEFFRVRRSPSLREIEISRNHQQDLSSYR
jgi:hypothetical protein